MEFENLIKAIGCIVLSIIIVAIPVITTLAYVVFKMQALEIFFTFLTIGEAIILAGIFFGEVN